MYQIVFKSVRKKTKMTKKKLLDFIEKSYGVPKDEVSEISVEETENEYIYTYTIRGDKSW